MSSNQVYRNDTGLGSSKYIPMAGNNKYILSSPSQTINTDFGSVVLWNIIPEVTYDNEYISILNNGSINILQTGIYVINCMISMNVNTGTSILYDIILYDVGEGQIIVENRGNNNAMPSLISTILVPFIYVGEINGGTTLTVTMINPSGLVTLTIDNKTQMYITRIV